MASGPLSPDTGVLVNFLPLSADLVELALNECPTRLILLTFFLNTSLILILCFLAICFSLFSLSLEPLLNILSPLRLRTPSSLDFLCYDALLASLPCTVPMECRAKYDGLIPPSLSSSSSSTPSSSFKNLPAWSLPYTTLLALVFTPSRSVLDSGRSARGPLNE